MTVLSKAMKSMYVTSDNSVSKTAILADITLLLGALSEVGLIPESYMAKIMLVVGVLVRIFRTRMKQSGSFKKVKNLSIIIPTLFISSCVTLNCDNDDIAVDLYNKRVEVKCVKKDGKTGKSVTVETEFGCVKTSTDDKCPEK